MFFYSNNGQGPGVVALATSEYSDQCFCMFKSSALFFQVSWVHILSQLTLLCAAVDAKKSHSDIVDLASFIDFVSSKFTITLNAKIRGKL